MNDCNKLIIEDPCSLLINFIKSRNGKVSYAECHIFLNNKTNLTQIQINQCLNQVFPNNGNFIQNKWVGII